jgi:hypothetical protein
MLLVFAAMVGDEFVEPTAAETVRLRARELRGVALMCLVPRHFDKLRLRFRFYDNER